MSLSGLSSLSKQDMVALLRKSWDNIEMVISEYPDDDEADDMDSPISYLINAVGDIQDAINLLEQE
jgi:hypothetical protein